MSSYGQMVKEDVVYIHNRLLLVHQKFSATYSNVDGPTGYPAVKLVRERQIHCAIPYVISRSVMSDSL